MFGLLGSPKFTFFKFGLMGAKRIYRNHTLIIVMPTCQVL